MCDPVSIGIGTAVAGGASALGSYQQGRAQTDATNQMRKNAYRDQLMMNQFKYQQDAAVYRQQLNELDAGLRESELALGKAFTSIDKRANERIGAARFAGESRMVADIEEQGKIVASMQAGRNRDRYQAIAKGKSLRAEAQGMDYLLRARYGDIQEGRDLVDQANSYRRKLASRVGPAPVMAPTPSAPVMQSGPSALSLIGGLGSAAIGGVSAGYGMAADLKALK